MTIDVAIENGVKSWIKNKGSILTISRMDIKAGCIGYEDVDVSYKTPATNNHHHIEQDGLSVYIQKGLRFKNNIATIGLSGIGRFKNIYVGGLDRGTI